MMPLSVPARISLQNILVATDFSCRSEAVLPYARSLARQYDATLFLAHVISPELLALDPAMADTAHVQAERLMDDLKSSGQLAGVRFKRILEEGETWDGLNRVIEQERITLMIVGTHGRTGLRKLFLGSVAENIFRRSRCPVMTIGPHVSADARREARFTHILGATDLQPGSVGSVHFAVSLAHDHGAHLTLLHVVEKGQSAPQERELAAQLPSDPGLSYSPELLIASGEPADVILQTSASRETDLIVMGARHHTGFSSHFRDLPYSVICEASCPVLIVGPECRAQA
jgi:nucleotide-binding universal stress UspA family protein